MNSVRVLLCVLATLGCGWVVFAQNTEYRITEGREVTFKIEPPSPHWGEGGRVYMEGWEALRVPGSPSLPVKFYKIALPSEGSYEVRLLDPVVSNFPGPRPRPAPSLKQSIYLVDSSATSQREFVEVASVYAQDTFYPESSPVKEIGVSVLRGQRILTLQVTPLLYLPSQEMYRFYEQLTVEILISRPLQTQHETPSQARSIRQAADPFFKIPAFGFVNNQDSETFRAESTRKRLLDRRGPVGMEVQSPETDLNSFKIKVSTNGLYRLTYSDLDGAGFNVGANPQNYRLFNKGVEFPIRIAGESDASFDSGDYIEFYGQGEFGENDSTKWNGGDFTDVNVYWLFPDSVAGLRVTERDVNPLSGYSIPSNFSDTIRYEQDNVFIHRVEGPTPQGQDRWAWEWMTGAPSYSNSYPLTVPSPAGGAQPDAQLVMELYGWTINGSADPDHQARVTLNGNLVADESWDGRILHTINTTFSHSFLTTSSTMDLEAVDLGIPVNYFYYNWTELTYTRLFEAYLDELEFDYTAGNYQFQIPGFSTPSIEAYDISDPVNPVRLVNISVTGAGPFTVDFEDSLAGAQTYFATASFLSPDSISQNEASDLANPANGADWIVITPSDFYSDPALDNLIAQRQGQGMRTMKVLLDDVYDEFNYGVLSPHAIRSFLQYAYDNFTAPAPAYVVLVGDTTYDYKVKNTEASFRGVPTMMQEIFPTTLYGNQASDAWFALVDGPDAQPDIHLGRLSVIDSAELSNFITRILDYENSPVPGAWQSHAVMVAGPVDEYPEEEFENSHDDAATEYFDSDPNYTYEKIYYNNGGQPTLYVDKAPYYGCNLKYTPGSCPGGTQHIVNDIVASFNNGAVLHSYAGHGAWDTWDESIFQNEDMVALSNGGMAPFAWNANCFTGGFQNPVREICFMEELTRRSGKGALAGYSETAIGYAELAQKSIKDGYLFFLGRKKVRNLGAFVALHRLNLEPFVDQIQGFALLGDPACNLVTPAPLPPINLQVDSVAPNTVNLSWTASTDPSVTGYHVYRQIQTLSWNRITGAPVAGTTYSDGGRMNCWDHQYYVVSVDGSGFIGADSNEVQGVPRNQLSPPTPTLASLTDPGLGARLDLTWTKPAEPPTVTGFILSWGTSPGVYTDTLGLDRALTSYTLGNLSAGTTYYVSIQATAEYCPGIDTQPVSLYSNELSATPTSGSPNAYTPPRMITDLDVAIDDGAGKVVLSWTAPTLDVYGGIPTLNEFGIYRMPLASTVPDRSPASPERIATVPYTVPGAYVYDDFTGYSLPQNFYYYVTAYDTNTWESSLGRPTPGYLQGVIWEIDESSSFYYNAFWPAPNPVPNVYGAPTDLLEYSVYTDTDPNFIPDRYNHGNWNFYTNLNVINCCESGWGCTIVSPVCDQLYIKVLIKDTRGNEGVN